MRINKRVRKKLLDNFKELKELHISNLKQWEEYIRTTETVEELMRQKKEILVNLINCLPLGFKQCYFCLLHDFEKNFENCYNCLYAKHHGICTHGDSDFAKIVGPLSELKWGILSFYYKGEKYDEK